MDLAALIAGHLPYLRRYARALSGDQESGDAQVLQFLESLAEDPASVTGAENARTALYRGLSRSWNSKRKKKPVKPQAAWENTTQKRLSTIPPAAREAFLLKWVEDFRIEDIARILERSHAEVEGLLAQASRSILDDVKTKIMIIEDDAMIAIDLEAIVTSIGHHVVGVAQTETEAVAMAAKTKPGLVLADIQLADGSSGLDAVNRILGKRPVPVIFITAYPEKLLTGQRPEPTFLIAKPFLTETVKALISQALFFKDSARPRAQNSENDVASTAKSAARR